MKVIDFEKAKRELELKQKDKQLAEHFKAIENIFRKKALRNG